MGTAVLWADFGLGTKYPRTWIDDLPIYAGREKTPGGVVLGFISSHFLGVHHRLHSSVHVVLDELT